MRSFLHFLSQCLNREESLFYKSDIKPLRKPVKHHQMLTVRRAREEVVASVVGNAIVRSKKRHVACLGDGVATEVEDALRLGSEEFGNDIGVETGACPHTAVREDPSMNIAAVEEMEAKFPDADIVCIE